MVILQRALKAEKYLSLLLLGYLTLGVSMQFKTYGGLLLPVYVIYTLALARTRKVDTPKSLLTLGSCLAAFLVAMLIVWLPYPGWFSAIILHGESNFSIEQALATFSSAYMGAGLRIHIILHDRESPQGAPYVSS